MKSFACISVFRVAHVVGLIALFCGPVGVVRCDESQVTFPMSDVGFLGYSPNGSEIYADVTDYGLLSIDAHTGRPKVLLRMPKDVFVECLSRDASCVVAEHCFSDQASVYASATGKRIRMLRNLNAPILNRRVFNATCSRCYALDVEGIDEGINCFSLLEDKRVWTVRHPSDKPSQFITVSGNDKVLVVGYVYEIHSYDALTGRHLARLSLPDRNLLPRFGALSDDGKQLALVGDDGGGGPDKALIMDIESGSITHSRDITSARGLTGSFVGSAVVTGDLSVFTVGTISQEMVTTIRTWDPTRNMMSSHRIKGDCMYLFLSRDGRQLLYCAHNEVRAFRLPDYRLLWRIPLGEDAAMTSPVLFPPKPTSN